MGDGRSGKREDEEEGIFQGAEQSGAPCPCLGKGENHIVGMCIVKAGVGRFRGDLCYSSYAKVRVTCSPACIMQAGL